MRAADFQARHAQLLQVRRRQRLRIRQLADRFAQIAECTHAASFSRGFDHEEEANGHVQNPEGFWHEGFAELFPVGWQQSAALGGGFELETAVAIVTQVVETTSRQVRSGFLACLDWFGWGLISFGGSDCWGFI